MVNMNMIVNASDLVVSEAETNKLKKAASRDAVSKLVKLWESKQAQKVKTFGGLGFMAVSLAACNSSSDDTATTTTPTTTTPTTTTPAVTATSAALTTAANTVAMTTGDDNITGSDTTLTAGDIIVDHNSDDSDTLTITGATYATAITSAGATVSGVENVTVNFNAMTATTFTASGVYGSVINVDTTLAGGNTTVTVDDANAGVTVNAGSSVTNLTVNGNGIADDTSITVNGGTATTVTGLATHGAAATSAAGDVTLTANSATTVNASGEVITVTAPAATAINLEGTTQTDDSATVATDGATTISMTSNVDGVAGSQIVETLNLSGSSAAVTATVTGGIETINVSGSQNVTIIVADDVITTETIANTSTGTLTVELSDVNGTSPDLSLVSANSIKINDPSLGAQTVTLAAGANVEYADEGAAVLTFDMDDDTTSNVTTGTLNLTLSDNITSNFVVDQTASSDNFNALAVTVTKAQTALDMRASTTVDVTMSGAVAVTLAAGATFKSLDAAAMTAAVTATTGASKKTITTGTGNDDITLDATAGLAVNLGAGNDIAEIGNFTLGATSVIDGGTGTDTLQLTHANANTGTGASAITGFEIFATTADASINSAHIAGKVIVVTGANALTLTNINTANVDMSNVTSADAFTTVINANANIGSLIGAGTAFALTGTAKADAITGNNGNDTIIGGAGGDTLTGGAGDDNVSGGTGIDSLIGGSGDDTLTGGDGADTIRGDVGTDTLTGGAGDDDFIFGGGAATTEILATTKDVDTITDYVQGSDDIQFDLSEIETAATQFAGATLDLAINASGVGAAAGAVVVQEVADQAGGAAVASAANATLFILLTETYATVGAMADGLETGDHELTIHTDGAADDAFLALYSDGTNAYVALVSYDAAPGTDIAANDLVAENLVNLGANASIDAGDYVAGDFAIIA
jgi:hypothetical protein